MGNESAVLIAGATGSGKSALALAVAQAFGGVVINADSMQVYAELRVLTARPSAEDEARAPHRLYGHVPAREAYSTGRWLADVEREIGAAREVGRLPIIVGGTGLYFKALLGGLSPIPPIPDAIREHWRGEAERHGAPGLHAELARCDGEMAARLNPADTQRIVRALEVWHATGKSLAHWQTQPGRAVVDEAACVKILLILDRDALYRRCDARFEAMAHGGALAEVEALLALDLPPTLPAMRAIGVRSLARYLRGEQTLPAAIVDGQGETRRYVKRQTTWAQSHMIAWKSLNAQYMERTKREINNLIVGQLDLASGKA